MDAEESTCLSRDDHVASKLNWALIMKEERDHVYWVDGKMWLPLVSFFYTFLCIYSCDSFYSAHAFSSHEIEISIWLHFPPNASNRQPPDSLIQEKKKKKQGICLYKPQCPAFSYLQMNGISADMRSHGEWPAFIQGTSLLTPLHEALSLLTLRTLNSILKKGRRQVSFSQGFITTLTLSDQSLHSSEVRITFPGSQFQGLHHSCCVSAILTPYLAEELLLTSSHNPRALRLDCWIAPQCFISILCKSTVTCRLSWTPCLLPHLAFPFYLDQPILSF